MAKLILMLIMCHAMDRSVRMCILKTITSWGYSFGGSAGYTNLCTIRHVWRRNTNSTGRRSWLRGRMHGWNGISMQLVCGKTTCTGL